MKKILGLVGLFICWGIAANAYCYSTALDEVIKLMLKNDYYAALDECNRLERTYLGDEHAELLYAKAECYYLLENYEQARDIFKQGLKYAKGTLLTKLYIGIADTYFMQHGYDKAISIYKQLLDKKETDYEAALLFKLGKAYQKNSKWTQSKYYFDLLEKKYPQSFEREIVDKSSVGGNFFTIQVGCFFNQANADKLSNDLRGKGYAVYVTPFLSHDTKLYRVRVGEFVSLIAAEHTEQELKDIEHLPTHIFP
ncbi:MAG: SPOR domain-containing protein [Candidatus Omnitrophica bacterium]|nr:SPOR domain-containing protein [Candidatus Omnitrophota bacterium]